MEPGSVLTVGEALSLPRSISHIHKPDRANPYYKGLHTIHPNTQLHYLAGGYEPPLRWVRCKPLSYNYSNDLEKLYAAYFLIFSMTSMPPRYFLRTSGTTTEPSARWFCSTMAGKIREVARPEPFRVWTKSILPSARR